MIRNMNILQIFRRKKQLNTLSPSKIIWHRFMKNKPAVFGLIIIAASVFIALFAYIISPDSTPFANRQHLELATKKPGFKVQMLKVRKNIIALEQNYLKTLLYGKYDKFELIPFKSYSFNADKIEIKEYTEDTDTTSLIREFNLADVLYPVKANSVKLISKDKVQFTDVSGKKRITLFKDLRSKIQESNIVTKRFLLGTDRFGRDMLSRLLIGTRVSLSVGFISVFISLIIGLSLGIIAGYYRGVIDNIILWLINVVWSIPTLLLVIAITLALGKGFWQVFIAVGLSMWVEVARVARGQVLSIRKKEYIEAGKALGFTNLRILTKHILPNVISPVIVISAANFASAILIEAGLSFLGIGVQPPMPSWGSMIKDHYAYIIVDSAYLAILPGLAIMIMVLAFTLVGNGLRDALDTKVAG